MSLPKIAAPTYTITLPISKQKVIFRPFTVKEEKNLVIVIQNENEETVLYTLIDLLKACTDNKLDIENLPLVDFQYLMMFLRAKSVGEEIDSKITCNSCGLKSTYSLEIPKLVVKQSFAADESIKITSKLSVVFSAPTIKAALNSYAIKDSELVDLASNIKTIQVDSEVYDANSWTLPTLVEFIEGLPAFALGKMVEYFKSVPKLVYIDQFDCPHCGTKQEVHLEGIENFFV